MTHGASVAAVKVRFGLSSQTLFRPTTGLIHINFSRRRALGLGHCDVHIAGDGIGLKEDRIRNIFFFETGYGTMFIRSPGCSSHVESGAQTPGYFSELSGLPLLSYPIQIVTPPLHHFAPLSRFLQGDVRKMPKGEEIFLATELISKPP